MTDKTLACAKLVKTCYTTNIAAWYGHTAVVVEKLYMFERNPTF